MLPHMEKLKPYGQYWFVTITPYGKEIEPHVPNKQKVMEDFKTLSKIVGINRIGWRYDPIFTDNKHTTEWHINQFRQMTETLSGYTNTCVISFIDIYKKVERNFPEANPVTKEEKLTIGKAFIEIAKEHNITIKPCAEGNDLEPYGADCNGCMTIQTFEQALQETLKVPKQKKNQRNNLCACLLGTDIGAYDTCGHLCKYCYANTDAALVKDNRNKHDPNSPFLIGNSQPEDVIHEAIQKSWIDRQIKLKL